MNVYIIEKSHDNSPSIVLGAFTTLEGAQRWINNPEFDVKSAREDMDEYDPHDTVDAYWFDGYYTRIREVTLQS